MTRSLFRLLVFGLSGIMLLSISASAQFVPAPWPGGYGVNPWGIGAGNTLQGQAQVINAVGQTNIAQEQARVEREAANQAKIDTQKKAFDQMLYERSLKPTFAEDQIYINNRVISRMMTSPQPAEISHGTTLNAFLPYIMKLSETGVQGPPVPVNQAALRHINVTTGPNGPRIGVLRSLPLSWPMALRGPEQKKFDPLLNAAVSAATTGALQPDLFNQVRSLVKKIEDDFQKRFRNEEVSAGDFLVASKFLDNLKPAVQALGAPDINRLLDGSLAPQGSNVPELASNMSFNGLTFAPGNPGSEAAYRSVHDSFVGYIRTAQASSGFQPRMRPPNPLDAKN
jgi:hypothetical protein